MTRSSPSQWRIYALGIASIQTRRGLLEERFTLSQLRGVPEAVLGEELQPSRPPHLRA